MPVIWMKNRFIIFLSLITCRANTHRYPNSTLCPIGFQHWSSSCYHIESTTTKASYKARLACESLGSRLVEITSVQEDEFIRSLALTENTSNYWIGMEQKNKDYHWMDGSPLTFTYWDPEEGAHNAGSDCIRMKYLSQHHWNDKPCDHLHVALCEGNRTDPVCTDEVDIFNSSCYFVGDHSFDRDEAMKHCEDRGAHLVYIETAEENSFILSHPDIVSTTISYWIGLTRRPPGSDQADFVWMSGESLGYSNINNLDAGSECLQIKNFDGYATWNDEPCGQKHGYICERKKFPRHQREQRFTMKKKNSVPSPESVIDDVRTYTRISCASRCISTKDCTSFAYNAMERRCILANSSTGTLSVVDGFRHYVT